MKYTKLYFALFLCVCFSVSLFAESPKREFRATWLATVSSIDWPNVKNNATSQKAALDDILDALEQANMNAVCFQVRSLCDAMYKSSYEPWSSALTGTRGKDPGYDPLAYLVTEAHKRGIEVHAWVNPFRYETSSGAFGNSDPVRQRMSSYILSYNNGSYSGTILDPGRPEVRQYTVDVIKEIVQNYDIDGVLFDDYFYPYGGTTTEDAASKALYKPSTQTDTEWRCDNIDKAMKAVYDMIQSTKPWVRFGIAPFGIWTTDASWATKYGISLPSGITGMNALEELACNTISWMDGGYVDYVSPQLYWATTSSGQSYITLSKWWSDMAKRFTDKRTDGKKIHFFSSNADYRSFGNAEMGLEMDYNRKYDQLGAPGAIFYNTNEFIATGLPAYLSANQFSQQSLPPAMDWKETTPLVAPTNVTLSGSTLSWTHSGAERFTVYAYTKGDDMEKSLASSSSLVAVVYGKSLNVSSVSGYANKTFAVCAYDRYGNEYTPGLYNSAPLDPAITATSAVSISGKIGQTPAPYVDVVVSGKYLTSKMSVSSTGSAFTMTPLSGWDDLAGGTLRITLNTALAANTYTGTITLKSGTVTKTITVTAIINPLKPTITLGASTLTLKGKQNAAVSPYKDVTVTAEDISSNLTIESSSDLVTVTKNAGWNNLTGGSIRITLNTAKSVGEHTCTVTVKNGTLSKMLTVNATITDLESILTASTTSVSLQGEEEGDAPYQDVTITGIDLSEAITITSSLGNAITITKQSGWNDLTGGVLRISLDTNQEIGTYSGTITITSGSSSVTITVNGEVMEESSSSRILVSSPKVSITAKQGTSPIPYVDVVVTGKSLRRTISIANSNSTSISAVTQSGWNTRTGGILRISPVSTTAAGTYTGSITLTSRNATMATIQVTIVITEVNTEILSSIASISLSGEQYSTPSYQDVVIAAKEVPSALAISTTAPVNVVPQNDWDELTGGTLRVYLDTDNEVGTYNGGTITVQSGSASAVINVNATITASTPKEGSITFDSNALWTQTPSTLSCLSTSANNRSMALYEGQLYISDKGAGAYHIINATTGAFVQTVSVGNTDFQQHNLRITKDGQMLFGNTGSGASTIAVRKWDMVTQSLTALSNVSIGGRSDYFYPYGKWAESGFLLALSNVGSVVKIPYANGVLQSAQSLGSVKVSSSAKSAKAIPINSTAFYTTATHTLPVKYNMSGTILEEFGSEKPALVGASGIGLFNIHGNNYMIISTDSLGGFEIFDITDGLNAATRVVSPVSSLGRTDNNAMTIEFCTNVSGDNVYIYQLVPNNGLRAYKFTFTPKQTSTKMDDIEHQEVHILPTETGVNILFNGTQAIAIYAVNGVMMHTAIATDVYPCDLPSGMYIIRVGDEVRKFIR